MRHHFYLIIAPVLAGNTGLFSYFAVITLLITASIIDVREHRIPDRLVLAGVIIGLIFTLLDPGREFLDSVLGGMAARLMLLLIYYITKGSIGLGDVKLFGCVGIYLGFESTVSAMLIAAVLSGSFSLVLICINRDNKKRELPFAPFILAGALAAIVF